LLLSHVVLLPFLHPFYVCVFSAALCPESVTHVSP